MCQAPLLPRVPLKGAIGGYIRIYGDFIRGILGPKKNRVLGPKLAKA